MDRRSTLPIMEYIGYVIDQRIPLTTPEDLNTFLSTGVRENFILDFKRDFPKNLEKTLVAFANTYGGTILIGVDETPTGTAVLAGCVLMLLRYLRIDGLDSKLFRNITHIPTLYMYCRLAFASPKKRAMSMALFDYIVLPVHLFPFWATG
jgi:hypothetical protein